MVFFAWFLGVFWRTSVRPPALHEVDRWESSEKSRGFRAFSRRTAAAGDVEEPRAVPPEAPVFSENPRPVAGGGSGDATPARRASPRSTRARRARRARRSESVRRR